jgi:hypothetical protein
MMMQYLPTNVGPVIGGVVAILVLFWVAVLRPRRGNCTNAPPLVTNNIPFVGVLIEFFSSPNTMVQRCYNDYGPVFTIPVRCGNVVFQPLFPQLTNSFLPTNVDRFFINE